MSREKAKEFMQRIKEDEEFRNRVQKAEGNEAQQAVVRAEGFDFTEDEYRTVYKNMSKDDLDEIWAGQEREMAACFMCAISM